MVFSQIGELNIFIATFFKVLGTFILVWLHFASGYATTIQPSGRKLAQEAR